jgi:hypothetical protein
VSPQRLIAEQKRSKPQISKPQIRQWGECFRLTSVLKTAGKRLKCPVFLSSVLYPYYNDQQSRTPHQSTQSFNMTEILKPTQITARNQRGQFAGQAGPGRPKGVRNQATVLLELMNGDDMKEIIAAMTKKAKEGDVLAARLLMDRTHPAPKGRRVSFPLPEVQDIADVAQAFNATIRAMADGLLSPDEAAVVGSLLTAKRTTLESTELEKRLAALEADKARRDGARVAA